ncbi:MAG: pyridoxal-phosphate dependent enzyme, partial [Synergistaceae bacterium]|nr:pyridoxal-phosphate dependent enzyme [Synergistaceae bacterium]
MVDLYENVLAAAERLDGVAHKTPVATSRLLDEQTSNSIFIKCENLQRAGAFKFRGAYNALSCLSSEERRRGVVAYSSGNHAQGVALAARVLDVPAVIVMPADAPKAKSAAAKAYGAKIVFYDRASEDREFVTKRLMDEHGYILIPPFDHEEIVAGQGTVVKELIDEVGELDYLFVQCSGGGLLSGSAVSAKHLCPKCKIFGVQPEGADYSVRAFKTGEIYRMKNAQTIADGLRGTNMGKLPFSIAKEWVDDMFTVSDADIIRTLYFVWSRMKLLVEAAGVVGLAPLFNGRYPLKDKRVGIIFSGGNCDIPKTAALFADVAGCGRGPMSIKKRL